MIKKNKKKGILFWITGLSGAGKTSLANQIKKETLLKTMAVGAIINPRQAEDIILYNRADLIAIGRELLADPQWAYKAAIELKEENAYDNLPPSYSFYLSRRDKWLDRSAKPS